MLDLHTHSTFSDGTLSPAEIVRESHRRGLRAVALTDHDTVAGAPTFMAVCARTGLEGVPGVELSASWHGGSLHIVGLFIDPENATLDTLLRGVRDNRRNRNQAMITRLRANGMAISMEDVVAEAGGDVVGRPHFASVLVRKGYCQTYRDVFDHWLGMGKPAYIRRFLPLPTEAIDGIHAAGGVAIMAHPFGNPNGTAVSKVRKMLKTMAAIGLDGLEVYYSDHSPAETAQARQLAADFGLLISGGSDFHGDRNPGVELGAGRGDLHVPDQLLEPLRARAARGR
ncbi:MAG: PHP domain-containing protein [Lentisphaeria bacterium]|nr:PHP domain-containing protein [Lentisphaeria bacterium]